MHTVKPAKSDGPPRGVHCLGGRVLVGQSCFDGAAVPAHDEQPVIHPDAQPEEDRQVRGEARDRHHRDKMPTAEVAIPKASNAAASGMSDDAGPRRRPLRGSKGRRLPPTRTELPGLGRSQLLMAGPPNEMCTSGPSADSAAWTSWPASGAVMVDDCLLQVTVAKATVPSRLIWDAPLGLNGLLTVATPGTCATLVSAPVTAVRTSGSERLCRGWLG